MVAVERTKEFKKSFKKLDNCYKKKVIKLIEKF